MAGGRLLVVVSTAAILVLTLTPGAPGSSVSAPWTCVICGEFGTANLLRNILLFFPLGVGLGVAARGRRPMRSWLPAVALTAGIEGAQIFLPGRNPLLVDVIANAMGAGLGILLVGALMRSRYPVRDGDPVGDPDPGRDGDLVPSRDGARSISGPGSHPATSLSRRLASAAPAVVAWSVSAAVVVGSAWAFQLDPPEPPHFLQVQADLGHLAFYEGQVVSVLLGDEALERGVHPDPVGLEARLFGGTELTVHFEAGPPPPRVAPLFSVYTGRQREVLLVGVEREDVVVRLPLRAANLRLERPDFRMRDGLSGVKAGDPMRVGFRFHAKGDASGPGSTGACLEVIGEGQEPMATACGLRPTLGDGWKLLLFPHWVPPAVGMGISALWLIGLGLLPGLFAGSWGKAGAAAGGLLAVAAVAPGLLGSLAVLPLLEGMLLVAGVGVGRVAQGWPDLR